MLETMQQGSELVSRLSRLIPWHGKEAIQPAAQRFNHPSNGDDGAVIPNPTGPGWLVLAAEGMTEDFLKIDPWFAGWSAVMANISDITAMGGYPSATVDVHWSCSEAALDGIAAAAEAFAVPVVGGHSGATQGNAHLAVAMIGHTMAPLHGNAAQAGDDLIAVIDQRGQWRGDFPFWNAATTAPVERLRGDYALVPQLAEEGLLHCGRDISMGGIYQTAALIAEQSQTCLSIDPLRVPGVDQENEVSQQERRLLCFPSFGFLFAVKNECSHQVIQRFGERDLCARVVGIVEPGPARVTAKLDDESITLRDISSSPLTGF